GAEHLRGNRASVLAATLQDELRRTDMHEVIAEGLHEFLDALQVRMNDVHNAVQETFIDYPTSRAKILA
ncbi:MAG TPA: alpha-E domain-containing protein, partial [Opitutaceae bacterium]|nr:alpha-E domain-containing protein [Opitutaceae bacterium]